MSEIRLDTDDTGKEAEAWGRRLGGKWRVKSGDGGSYSNGGSLALMPLSWGRVGDAAVGLQS